MLYAEAILPVGHSNLYGVGALIIARIQRYLLPIHCLHLMNQPIGRYPEVLDIAAHYPRAYQVGLHLAREHCSTAPLIEEEFGYSVFGQFARSIAHRAVHRLPYGVQTPASIPYTDHLHLPSVALAHHQVVHRGFALACPDHPGFFPIHVEGNVYRLRILVRALIHHYGHVVPLTHTKHTLLGGDEVVLIAKANADPILGELHRIALRIAPPAAFRVGTDGEVVAIEQGGKLHLLVEEPAFDSYCPFVKILYAQGGCRYTEHLGRVAVEFQRPEASHLPFRCMVHATLQRIVREVIIIAQSDLYLVRPHSAQVEFGCQGNLLLLARL